MNKKIIFYITITGSAIVVLVLHFATIISIDVTMSILILAATAWVIATQAFATEEMVKNQIRPSVDVSMIFDKEDLGTSFQFLNITKVPTFVWITVNIKKDNKDVKLSDDYLNGKERIDIDVKSWITSSNFLKDLTKENESLEAILKVEVAPMFDKKARSLFQEKSYRFDSQKKEWIRTPFWGIAEAIDPKIQEAINKNNNGK